MISFDEISDQWQQAFGGDLGIVHPEHGEKPVTIFASHYPHGTYTLTLFPARFDPDQFTALKIILIGCMDKRQAAKLYQAVLDLGYQPQEAAALLVAGGMVQHGQERCQALKDGLAFIVANAPNLEKIMATGHSHRCGAVHFWGKVESGKLHPRLGIEPGGSPEKNWMRSLIAEGAQNIVLPALREANSKAQVETWLLSLPDDQISIEKFDFTQTQPRSVSDLLAKVHDRLIF